MMPPPCFSLYWTTNYRLFSYPLFSFSGRSSGCALVSARARLVASFALLTWLALKRDFGSDKWMAVLHSGRDLEAACFGCNSLKV